MSSPSRIPITPQMRAEASAWIARLHAPNRSARVEAGFKAWLNENPAHAHVFEQTTQAWEAIGSVPTETLSSMVRWDRIGSRRVRLSRIGTIAVAAIILITVASTPLMRDSPYTTDVGERRTLALRDGTRVHLNTASRLFVRYDGQKRLVELEAGEALFEVAKHPQWPFVVIAGAQQIVALGTSFVVRRDDASVAVTLVEGKVMVDPVTAEDGRGERSGSDTRTLEPGERLTFVTHAPPRLDTPSIEKLTAWQLGQVILDETVLADAVVEMNRYSAKPLVIENPRTANVRMSGAFRAGDSRNFAQAVAATYRLRVSEESDRIVITGTPSAAYQ